MPTSLIKAYAKESGKSIEEVEVCWNQAKKMADATGKFKEKDGTYWAFVNAQTKKCAGILSNQAKE